METKRLNYGCKTCIDGIWRSSYRRCETAEGDKVIFTVLDHPFFAELVEVEQEPELLMEGDLVDMDEDDSPTRYNVAFTECITSDFG